MGAGHCRANGNNSADRSFLIIGVPNVSWYPPRSRRTGRCERASASRFEIGLEIGARPALLTMFLHASPVWSMTGEIDMRFGNGIVHGDQGFRERRQRKAGADVVGDSITFAGDA